MSHNKNIETNLPEKQFFQFAKDSELTVTLINKSFGFICFIRDYTSRRSIVLVTQKGEERVFKSLDSFYNTVQKYNDSSIRLTCHFFGEKND